MGTRLLAVIFAIFLLWLLLMNSFVILYIVENLENRIIFFNFQR